ncbi:hypothetical protein D3C87_1979990 [compost metagenome]
MPLENVIDKVLGFNKIRFLIVLLPRCPEQCRKPVALVDRLVPGQVVFRLPVSVQIAPDVRNPALVGRHVRQVLGREVIVFLRLQVESEVGFEIQVLGDME